MPVKCFLAFFCLIFMSAFAQSNKITLLTEAMEPFITEKNQLLTGPFIEAFQKIANDQNIEYEFQKTPIRRGLKDIEKMPNHCVFSANYSPETSEILLYVSKLAQLKIWAYSAKKSNINLKSIQNLKKYKVGVIDIAEVKDILSLNGVQYSLIFKSDSAIKMLLSNRFDILVSDINLDLLNKDDTKKIKPNLEILTVEKWLICNNNLKQQLIKKLREALSEALFSTKTKEIWQKYNMLKFYTTNRNEFSPSK
ncbi:transporter substrate-binding domain-containing protein [Pigmentibacter sp. JX0631]|uniref:transporter substrate-binding domain-containing protein n=1 Tax=Pigmentibacter sp. JX0631 TaxID=2976982 RepID=UPI002468BA3D|nr:transporter substrate-binding domain-containing protein [Pigmentibacter sp. JX0631]WGL60897.1 transporter substrate-binding domain-containing protein [Pigmentibacter sp. JX0631]